MVEVAPGAGSVRDHMEQVARAQGVDVDDLLERPQELPETVAHLWVAFCQMSNARTSNGFGPNPLTYHDVEAWSRVTGVELTAWEIDVLKRLDVVFLTVATKNARPRTT